MKRKYRCQQVKGNEAKTFMRKEAKNSFCSFSKRSEMVSVLLHFASKRKRGRSENGKMGTLPLNIE